MGFTFIWKIENFSFLLKLPKNNEILSPVAIADNLGNTSWFLRLHPPGYSEGNEDTFVFQLSKSSKTGPNLISLDYELSILSKTDSNKKSVTVRAYRFHQGDSNGKPLRITSQEIFNKREILPVDTLSVQCKMWYHQTQCLEPGFSLAHTLIGAVRKSFTWIIDNFSTLSNDEKSVDVLFFSKQQIYLTLTLSLESGWLGYFEKNIHIKIKGKSKEKNSTLMLGISVQDTNGKSVHHFQNEFTLRKENEEWRFPMVLERKQLIEAKDLLLPGDKLSLKCDLTVYDVVLNQIELSTFGSSSTFDLEAALTNTTGTLCLGKRKRHSSSNSLTNDLRYLFEEKQQADVNLRVHNEIFPVHKAILVARSPVFKTMFDTDMKEKLTNTIEIDDIEPDTIRRLLLYIYSDTLDSDTRWENACSLYLAAEKYAVLGLKEKCSSYLMANLNVTNVCETLVLADTLSDEGLKNFILSFIEDKDKVVLNSNEWKDFAQNHPQLTVDIVTRLYRNVKQF